MYDTRDGRVIGPRFGIHAAGNTADLLHYSNDEQVLVTGSREGMLRFWKATAPPAETLDLPTGEHRVWSPSGDRAALALPGTRNIAIGDPAGHVHIVPAGVGIEALRAIDEDVSFVGHSASVRRLGVARDGSLVASAAADNSIRVWSTDDGKPLPYVASITGSPVTQLAFSPDASLLAVMNDDRVELLDAADGKAVTGFDLGELHSGLAFADSRHLFIGGESGALRLIEFDGNRWDLRQVWQGDAAIRALEASRRGRHLVLVDELHRASQFALAEGQMHEGSLQLPGPVRDVVFTLGGGRVLLHSARWVHRASSSPRGLTWLDSVLVPQALPGARIIFGSLDPSDAGASMMYLPAVSNGLVDLVELAFGAPSTPRLFGNKDELLAEWETKIQGRLPQVAPQGTDQ